MLDMTLLTDAELDLVAGGQQTATATANYNSQSNTAYVTQYASAYNSGAVTATGGGSDSTTVAVGALAANTSLIEQTNSIRAVAVNRYS